MFRLQCQTQSYDWGKLGDISKVAHYAKESGSQMDPSKPYAELWMGTHPNAPSVILPNKSSLKDEIKNKPELSTLDVYNKYHGDLPFLFKVLSIRKALSIQAHPDKALGAKLFKEHPDIYKDPNHKPEMAIAITPFEALCGFRPLDEITDSLKCYPEMSELVGEACSTEFVAATKRNGSSETDKRGALKSLFEALMTSSQERVQQCVEKLVQRLKAEKDDRTLSRLVIRLDEQYPGGDVGVFGALLLNYVTLEPGQAIFLGANEPHAYLSGDCVECMATSDNVVRAGLTPKFKDVSVLVNMLTYRYGSAESQKTTPVPYGPHSVIYDPPIEEFSVVLTRLGKTEQEVQQPINGPSILIVTRGCGSLATGSQPTESVKEGHVFFISAGATLNASANEEGLECYRAFSTVSTR